MPEVKATQSKSKAASRMGSSSFQIELKKRLLEVLANIDTASPTEVQAMLEAASASSSTENQNNGDMEDPQGIAQVYHVYADEE